VGDNPRECGYETQSWTSQTLCTDGEGYNNRGREPYLSSTSNSNSTKTELMLISSGDNLTNWCHHQESIRSYGSGSKGSLATALCSALNVITWLPLLRNAENENVCCVKDRRRRPQLGHWIAVTRFCGVLLSLATPFFVPVPGQHWVSRWQVFPLCGTDFSALWPQIEEDTEKYGGLFWTNMLLYFILQDEHQWTSMTINGH
jgi:hypothetical protein